MRARHLYRLVVMSVAFAVLVPFIVLSRLGMTAEGVCFQTGFADDGALLTAEETQSEYFRSPELASIPFLYINDWLAVPVCTQSLRGEHRFQTYSRERDLRRLGAPGFARLHETNPNAQVLRVLTQASFSSASIAVTLTRSASAAEVRASWLVVEDPVAAERDSGAGTTSAKSSGSTISPEEAERLWGLALRSRPLDGPMIDGNVLMIEIVDRGRRRVRTSQLGGGEATQLLCGLANAAGVPADALANGRVNYVCKGVDPVSWRAGLFLGLAGRAVSSSQPPRFWPRQRGVDPLLPAPASAISPAFSGAVLASAPPQDAGVAQG